MHYQNIYDVFLYILGMCKYITKVITSDRSTFVDVRPHIDPEERDQLLMSSAFSLT